MDPFVHLHVASGYSLRHGASHPHLLVERAAGHGMDTLALTDRDGTYGAVRFAKACQSAGIRPVLGVDLAVAPVLLDPAAEGSSDPRARARSGPPGTAGAIAAYTGGARDLGAGGGQQRRSPARGGSFLDPGLPRVTVLAEGKQGWASLCRLVSAVHLAGERGTPIATLDLVAAHSAGLVVLLGPASEAGRALARRRPDLAAAHLRRWRAALDAGAAAAFAGATASAGAFAAGASGVGTPAAGAFASSASGVGTPAPHPSGHDAAARPPARGRTTTSLDTARLFVEVVHHRGPGDVHRAARLFGFAAEQGLPAVLTNQVRYADRSDAPVADVLDASRRLVALDARHLDRTNAEGHLKSGKEMAELAEEVAGWDSTRLLTATRTLAERCVLDVKNDLGIGTVHFPELETSSWSGADRERGPGAADRTLRDRCIAGVSSRGIPDTPTMRNRLDDELGVIAQLGFPTYFLTVADVVDLIKGMNVRAAARGSGAGSLVTYLLGISDINPLRYGLLMERFLSPLRHQLPDVDIDVESARRMEVYTAVLERYGGDRCACVAMMDTYRVRHGIRDVGAALGLPPGEIDAVAKAFPHIRANQVRAALRDLPELRASGISAGRLDLLFKLVERLDGLPRHIALHPCGVLLSDNTLLDRTPVEASFLGFPMSQFDKDDVEDLGLLKLDLLGIRMQSAIRHTLDEVERLGLDPPDDMALNIDDIPRDDPRTFDLIRSTKTLGCFQIESPGQRELVGKFGPETFEDMIVDISLFRPGPVKSDMVRPFLETRQEWKVPEYPHPDLEYCLAETGGVVVFHEQVLEIIATMAGCTLAEADEARRALGNVDSHEAVRRWFVPAAFDLGYDGATIERVWEILKAFGSFGFCKAHAAAFALPTYQSAYLKAHYPAAFLSGVLTHDPGMYPKRLILDDARQFGIAILPLDVNASDSAFRVERVDVFDEPPPKILDQLEDSPSSDPELLRRGPRPKPPPELPDGRGTGIRIGLADVKGISDAEVARIIAGRPFASLSDFWHRAAVSRPVVERLVVAGAFDEVYGIGRSAPVRRRGVVTRRDLLLQVGELDQWARATARAARTVAGRSRRPRGGAVAPASPPRTASPGSSGSSGSPSGSASPGRARTAPSGSLHAASPWLPVATWPGVTASPSTADPRGAAAGLDFAALAASFGDAGVRPGAGAPPAPPATGWPDLADTAARAARQSQATRVVEPEPVQLALDLGDAPGEIVPSGLPELTPAELVRAELDVLGLDVSRHVVDFYVPFFEAAGIVRARDLLGCRSGRQVLVAGVKVATQTPPIRSGRRVVFVTLDDATGPLDATFFEDAQAGYASTIFHSWLLVIKGEVRRTGPRGISLLGQGCWELPALHTAWFDGGLDAVAELLAHEPGWDGVSEAGVRGAAESRSTRPVIAVPPPTGVEVMSTGFRRSPYSDIKPSGGDSKSAPRKLWHSSPGSSGA